VRKISGFTVLELLIVIAIVGVLLATAMSCQNSIVGKTKCSNGYVLYWTGRDWQQQITEKGIPQRCPLEGVPSWDK
jgi:prepilin-type N-terminal cleavage/methylation domain-containing protein